LQQCFAIPADADGLPEALAAKAASAAGKPLAYRCVGLHCELPIEDIQQLG
jgi:hypothetical protein